MNSLAPITHRFLVIEGNIGAGKTTLCQMLERDYQCRLILEQFTDNPFLPLFYEQPERYAFPVELFFMTERHKQLQSHLTPQQLFHTLTVSDYYFAKTLLFARNTLDAEEFRLFQQLFNILHAHQPKPDLLVYLYRPVDDLLHNIRNRGREYEQQIKSDYLEKLQHTYLEFFRSNLSFPVLILDIEQISFWEHEHQYRSILEAIGQTYPPGLHRKCITKEGSVNVLM